MGNSSTQPLKKTAAVTQRFLSVDRAVVSPDGKHLFCKVMYDADHFSPSFILKIEIATSLILDKFFLSEPLVDRMRVSPRSDYIAIQGKKNFYVYDLQTKQAVVNLDLRSSWFVFEGNSLYFRTNKCSFSQVDLKNLTFRSFLEYDNKMSKISQILVTKGEKIAFFLANFNGKTSNRIVKFDLDKNHILHAYKSSRDIRFIIWVESARVLLAGKYSDSLSVYSVDGDILNVKNLNFDGLLLSAREVLGTKKVLAYYQCDVSGYFAVWSLESYQLEVKIKVRMEMSNNYFNILVTDPNTVIVQNDNEVIQLDPRGKDGNQTRCDDSDEEEQLDFSMKKLLQVQRTNQIQQLVIQRSVDLELKRYGSLDDIRLSKIKENESLLLNSHDMIRTPNNPRKKGFTPRLIDNISEIDARSENRQTTATKLPPNDYQESRLSRLFEEFLPGKSHLKADSSSSCNRSSNVIASRFSKMGPSMKKTIIKTCDSNSGFFSSVKKNRKKRESNAGEDEDNKTVKHEKSSVSLERLQW